MPGETARSTVTCVGLGLLLFGALLVASPATAGILDATWTAPTTNTDGSPLNDLATYRLYYGTASSPCPGSTFAQVSSPTASPGTNQSVSFRLTGLSTGTSYNVSVQAVDANGNTSACSGTASAIARADFSVSPTGSVNFGSVVVQTPIDKVFTVTNTGGGTVSGSASVVAPFQVVSGSPFSLNGVGATQAVTVRFTPTTTTTATATISFTANGGTATAVLTGTGLASSGGSTPVADTTKPTVSITAPTSASTFSTTSTSLSLQGSAADNVGVSQVAWANSRGGSGTAGGTTAWSASSIPLQLGSNVLTVTARDAAGNTGSAALTVSVAAPADTTAPTVSVTAPSSGATASGTATVTASATDNVGVVGVQFLLDGAPLGTEKTAPPFSVSWSTTSATNGAHTLSARARDAAGNTALAPNVSVTVANALPAPTPPTDTTPPAISQVTISGITSSTVTINWTTSEASDSQVAYGRRFYGNVTPLNKTFTTSHSEKLTGLAPNTRYHYQVRSRDAAGNLGVSQDFIFRTGR